MNISMRPPGLHGVVASRALNQPLCVESAVESAVNSHTLHRLRPAAWACITHAAVHRRCVIGNGNPSNTI
eukprot:4377149-Prymnesium_polylepis.1